MGGGGAFRGGPHPEEVLVLEGPSRATPRLFFHTERIKLLRFRPLALFALTLKAPLHRPYVYSWGGEEGGWGGSATM